MSFYELVESANRYSVEVNYRTTFDEVQDNFAQLVLGYVSSAMKGQNYHVKLVFDEKPYRIIISSRNWQEGEWVNVVSWSPERQTFMISKGFFHKPTKNVIVQNSRNCSAKSAVELHKEVINSMNKIKDEKPHHVELNPVKGRTGPTKGSMRPAQGLLNAGKPEKVD